MTGKTFSMYVRQYSIAKNGASTKRLTNGKLDPLIVVGIDNGGWQLRPKEYLPYVDETLSPPEPHPEGKLYPRFLLDEVVPFVEARYRVLRGPRIGRLFLRRRTCSFHSHEPSGFLCRIAAGEPLDIRGR